MVDTSSDHADPGAINRGDDAPTGGFADGRPLPFPTFKVPADAAPISLERTLELEDEIEDYAANSRVERRIDFSTIVEP